MLSFAEFGLLKILKFQRRAVQITRTLLCTTIYSFCADVDKTQKKRQRQIKHNMENTLKV